MTKQLTMAGLLVALALATAFAPMPAQPGQTEEANVTVIYKTNPNWPVLGMITSDPCAVRTCNTV